MGSNEETAMKVLLVDDSKAARFAMGKLLKDQGLDVEMATSGEEALDKIATQPIDLVFMDQSMPGMGGIAATQAITGNDKTAHIPVVLCTGNEGDKLEQMAEEAGAIGVLTKPPKEDRLKAVLSTIQVEDIIPAIEELEASESAAKQPDRDEIMDEVGKLLHSVHHQVSEVETKLREQMSQAMRASEQRLQPLTNRLDGMDKHIEEKVREQLSVESSTQRIQLEALRQQVETGLEEMHEREDRLRRALLEEIGDQVPLQVRKEIAALKEALEETEKLAEARLEAVEDQLTRMEKRLMIKCLSFAALAGGLAFAASYFLI